MLNTHSPLSGYYPSNKVPSRSTFTLFGKENWRLSFLCEGSKLMICVMYVWYVRIWRNNVGEQQRSRFGNNVAQSNYFCLQATSHMKCNKLFWINCKTRHRDFEGKQNCVKTSRHKATIWNFGRLIIVVNWLFSKQSNYYFFFISLLSHTYYYLLPAPQVWPSLLPWYRESFPS